MQPSRRMIAFSLLSIMLGAVLGLAGPRKAAAAKLPVDCSGRKSECYFSKSCTQWIDHVCYEITTYQWYWYY